jgi:predicted MFS family arabinose efflux permease
MTTSDRIAVPSRPALAWLMWSLGALFYFQAFFHRVAPSVMVGELMQDLGLTAAGLGNLSALYFWGYAVAQFPTGLLADRWGPRRVLSVAAAICGCSALLFAFAESNSVASIGRLIVGFGAGFGFVTTLKIVVEWFPQRRFAMLSGLTLMMGTVGGIVGQAPLALAVDSFGWRGAMVGTAFFVLLLGLAIWLIVRDHPDAANNQRPEEPSHLFGDFTKLLRQPQILLLTAAGFASVGSLFAFGSLWGVPYLMEVRDFSRPAAAASTSMLLFGWGVGAPLIGWISDHLGKRKAPFVVSAMAALISIILLLHISELSVGMIDSLLFINGACSAGVVVAFAMVRENSEAHTVGSAMAILNIGVIGSGAVLQPLIGWLLDLNWDGQFEAGRRLYSTAAYDTAMWVLPVMAAVAVLLALLVRETHARTVAK